MNTQLSVSFIAYRFDLNVCIHVAPFLSCFRYIIHSSSVSLPHTSKLFGTHTHTYTQHIIDSNSVWVRCIVKYLRYMYIGNIYFAELSSLIRTIQFWLIRSVSVFYTVADICLAYYCCWCFCYNYCILLCIFFSPFEPLINKLLQQIYRTKKKKNHQKIAWDQTIFHMKEEIGNSLIAKLCIIMKELFYSSSIIQ